jgi:hypothetical protein
MNQHLTTILAAATIVSGLSVGAYGALNNELRGSDTLHTFTTGLVNSPLCVGVGSSRSSVVAPATPRRPREGVSSSSRR